MNSLQKITAMIDHRRGPVPWLEIAVDEAVMALGLGKNIPFHLLNSSIPVELSWREKVEFAIKVGLDALGIYHWQAFGSIEDNSRPVIARLPQIRKWTDLANLELPAVSYEELRNEVILAKEAIGDSGIALFVEFSSCLEFALADMGLEMMCLQLVDDPLFVEEVLDRYAAYTSHLVACYNRMPEVDFLWIGDDLAYKTGPFMSPGMLRKHVFPYIGRVVNQIQKPWFFHSDGDIGPVFEDILAWNPDAIHPIEGQLDDLLRYKKKYGDQVSLIGNLSVDLLSRGTPSEVASQTRVLLQEASIDGGYGFSSGNALTRYMPIENVLAAADVIQDFNSRAFGS
jgi:uroporphyrinogen-III decarboxylase